MTAELRVRPPAVAGTFYPAERATLRRIVDADLEKASGPAHGEKPPKALVVPHAGYVYSGPVAGSGYARLEPLRGVVDRVVLLGPAHRVPVRGLAVPSVDALETPLGLLRVDSEGREAALRHPAVQVDDVPHASEHSLEVHLPFIQRVLGNVEILPLVVGHASAEEVAEVLEAVWGGPETLIVVSSDLSHYNDYETAQRLDRRTADAIVVGDTEAVGPNDACGAYPVCGLMEAAKRHGLKGEIVDLRNSGDTAGPRAQVVGYGAFTFTPADAPDEVMSDPDVQRALLDTAIDAIDMRLNGGREITVDKHDLPEAVWKAGASFVTLERDGALLGCTGTMVPVRPLIEDVAVHAVTSAFADPRLPEITRDDWLHMTVKVSVLSPLRGMDVGSLDELQARLRPTVDGILIEGAGRRATFLPSVWAKVESPKEFTTLLWRKAGLPAGAWPDDMRVERYTTTEFADAGPR